MTRGTVQQGLGSLMAAVPVGWAIGLVLLSYEHDAHRDAIAWFNAAARGEHRCPP